MSYRMLIVDDSLPMRAVIKKTIRACGYGEIEFLEASNGREALESLGDEWIDLVITDHNMPEMTGMELIQQMKSDDVIGSVPVVVVTTEGSHEMVEKFIALGAAGYIQKPFTPEAIRQKLTDILGEVDDTDSSDEDDDGGFDF